MCVYVISWFYIDGLSREQKQERQKKLEIVLANKPLSTSWCTEVFPLCSNRAHRGLRLNIFFRLCIFVLLFFFKLFDS